METIENKIKYKGLWSPKYMAERLLFPKPSINIQGAEEMLKAWAADIVEVNASEVETILKEKEAEIERLKNDLADALDVKNGNGPTALSMLQSRITAYSELMERMANQLNQCSIESEASGHRVLSNVIKEILTDFKNLKG